MMTQEAKDEVERRILALVRSFFDSVDESFEEGSEIGDFIIIWEVYEEIAQDATLKPWWGGPTRGRGRYTSFSTTPSTWSHTEAMVRETLRSIRMRRDADESEDDESYDEGEESEG
jgi:hypothetical protein